MAQTSITDIPAEIAEAQEAVAARLERLARLLRKSTGSFSVDQWDDAYRAVVQLASKLRDFTK